jgi:hypothetical protein
MIEKILGNTVSIVNITSKDRIKRLRDIVMNENPGVTFLEESKEYTFPAKFVLLFHRDLYTFSLFEVNKEYTV